MKKPETVYEAFCAALSILLTLLMTFVISGLTAVYIGACIGLVIRTVYYVLSI